MVTRFLDAGPGRYLKNKKASWHEEAVFCRARSPAATAATRDGGLSLEKTPLGKKKKKKKKKKRCPGEPGRRDPLANRGQRSRRLPLLLACRSAADHLGARRWIKLAGRGVLPVRQGSGGSGRSTRSRRYSILVPLGLPGHARGRLPHRRPRETNTTAAPPDGLIPLTCDAGPTIVHHARHPRVLDPRPPSWLVRSGDAATRPDPRPATTGDKPLKHEDPGSTAGVLGRNRGVTGAVGRLVANR